ncbi:Na(+)/H(+) antiporter subunit B [candidate division CSSED10-310 bacterium]|uniref:Na(+)/H(+) antiporter subunit B n=1 Tax=candidate division CSSED10-310 bacterium TaxID=2855610 RepID=A0ABV6YT39_UNCC1
MKIIGLITVVVCGAVLIYFTADFPAWSDPNSPASTHLSPYYIEHTMEDTSVPNIVTAVLADYRGYDTMYETAVIFTAGLACFFLLRMQRDREPAWHLYRHLPTSITIRIEKGGRLPKSSAVFRRIDSHWIPEDLIIKNTCRFLLPFIQLFALYVVAHGHHSPGGGFQGGVILGAAVILYAISHDLRGALSRLKEKSAALFSGTGVLLYAGTGTICILLGAEFLNYSALAQLLGTDAVTARSHGILIVEIGVAIAVMSVMVWIYYNLSSMGAQDEGL